MCLIISVVYDNDFSKRFSFSTRLVLKEMALTQEKRKSLSTSLFLFYSWSKNENIKHYNFFQLIYEIVSDL